MSFKNMYNKFLLKYMFLGKAKLLLSILSIIIFFSCEKDVSVSPPDEPPQQGSLIIDTYPKGFEIFLNGKDRARKTPDSLKYLKSASYNITLKKDLFIDSTFVVNVGKNEKVNLSIDYSKNSKMLGRLSIESSPAGAVIYLNDSNTTKVTPFTFNNLLPGNYDVKLKYKDHKDISSPVSVLSNKESKERLVLIDTTMWEEYNLADMGFGTHRLTSIVIDQNDLVWVGSRDGLILYDGQLRLYTPSNSKLPHQIVNDLGLSRENNLWIATSAGMALERNKEIVMKYVSETKNSPQRTGFPTDFITSVFVSDGFPYYFGADIGVGMSTGYIQSDLYVWPESQPFDNMYYNVSSVCVSSTTEDILIGTQSSGLLVASFLELQAGTFNIYNKSTYAMSSNKVSDLYRDKDGGVWASFIPDGSGIISSLVYYGNDKSITRNDLSTEDSKINTIFVDSRNVKWLGCEHEVIYFKYSVDSRGKLNSENSGVNIQNVTGIAEDSNGNIWIATAENTLFKLKNVDKLLKQ